MPQSLREVDRYFKNQETPYKSEYINPTSYDKNLQVPLF